MKNLLKKSSDDLKQNFAGGTFKKGGDQLSKIGNVGKEGGVGWDKITLSKKGGQMKKGGLGIY